LATKLLSGLTCCMHGSLFSLLVVGCCCCGVVIASTSPNLLGAIVGGTSLRSERFASRLSVYTSPLCLTPSYSSLFPLSPPLPLSFPPQREYSVTQKYTVNGAEVQAGIYRSETFNQSGQAVYGGPNDPRMGDTADLGCPGWFGHIELSRPVYHLGFIDEVKKALGCVCYSCGKLKNLLTKPDGQPDHEMNEIMGIKSRKKRLNRMHSYLTPKKICQHCQSSQPKYYRKDLHIEIEFPVDMEMAGPDRKQFFPASEAITVFSRMSDEDIRYLGLDPVYSRPEWLVVSVLPVPPLHVRPSIFAGGSQSHDDLTHQLVNVIKANLSLKDASDKGESR